MQLILPLHTFSSNKKPTFSELLGNKSGDMKVLLDHLFYNSYSFFDRIYLFNNQPPEYLIAQKTLKNTPSFSPFLEQSLMLHGERASYYATPFLETMVRVSIQFGSKIEIASICESTMRFMIEQINYNYPRYSLNSITPK